MTIPVAYYSKSIVEKAGVHKVSKSWDTEGVEFTPFAHPKSPLACVQVLIVDRVGHVTFGNLCQLPGPPNVQYS
jgi:hypothetical protein